MRWVWLRGTDDQARPADAAIVLGYALAEDGSPQPQMKGRAAGAAELYHRGVVKRFVASGGAQKAGRSEAQVLRELLIAHGVPSSAILLDEDARSTEENFACGVPLLRSLGVDRALVITEPWHMPRAMFQSGRYHGVELLPAPVTSVIWESPRHRSYWLFREAIALWVELARAPGMQAQPCVVSGS